MYRIVCASCIAEPRAAANGDTAGMMSPCCEKPGERHQSRNAQVRIGGYFWLHFWMPAGTSRKYAKCIRTLPRQYTPGRPPPRLL